MSNLIFIVLFFNPLLNSAILPKEIEAPKVSYIFNKYNR